jgi:hypothetical protein
VDGDDVEGVVVAQPHFSRIASWPRRARWLIRLNVWMRARLRERIPGLQELEAAILRQPGARHEVRIVEPRVDRATSVE